MNFSPTDSFVRVFVAFPVRGRLSDFCTQVMRKFKDIPGARWTRPENLHMTLFFIGEIRKADTVQVKGIFDNFVRAWENLSLRFEKLSIRGSKTSPSMIWMQFKKSEEFTRISEDIHAQVAPFMLIKPRHIDPIPHITLARLKRDFDAEAFKTDMLIYDEQVIVDRIELWKSIQAKEGVKYVNIDVID